jgi:hypothetical protein
MYPVKEDLSARVKAGVEATPICIVLPYDILPAFPNIELPFRKVLYVLLADVTMAK